MGKFLRAFPQAQQYYDKPVTKHRFKTLVIKNAKYDQPTRATKNIKAIVQKTMAQIRSNDDQQLKSKKKKTYITALRAQRVLTQFL